MKHLSARLLPLLLPLQLMTVSVFAQPFLESVGTITRLEEAYNTGGFFRLEIASGAPSDYVMDFDYDTEGRLLAFTGRHTDTLTNDRSYRCNRTSSGNFFTYTVEIREPSAGIAQFATQRIEKVYTNVQGQDSLIHTEEFDPHFGFSLFSYSLHFSYLNARTTSVQVSVNAMVIRQIELRYNGGGQLDSVLETSFNADPGTLTIYHFQGSRLDSISDFVRMSVNHYAPYKRTYMTTGTHGFSTAADIYVRDLSTGDWNFDETWTFNSGFPIGVQEDVSASGWQVYPNPANDHIRIDGADEAYAYTLFSAYGEEVLRGSVLRGQKVAVDGLRSGMYFLQIGQGVKRLLIH